MSHVQYLFLHSCSYTQLLYQIIHAGIDYLANLQNPSSRLFTVVFQSKQVNSSEHVIPIADDAILEGSESFRLRIVGVWFTGQAAVAFRAQDGLANTFADVNIADDDGKFRNSACTICLQIAMKQTCAYVHPSHAMFSSVVRVNWTISRPINVTEGDNVTVRLSGAAFGFYANPIAIGVICAEVIATDVEPGMDTTTSTDTIGCCWYGLC